MSIACDFKSAPCMLCGNHGLTFVNNVRDDDVHWVASCNTCRHVQLTPLPTIEEDDKFYQTNEMARRFFSKSESDDIQLMYRTEPWAAHEMEIAKRFVSATDSILEIGSGYGWFVQKMKAEGYDVEGIELSDEKCAMAMEHLGVRLANFNILSGASAPPNACV